jgi:hypothetical protein
MPARGGEVSISNRIGIETGLMRARPKKKKSRRNWRLSRVNREASNRGRNRSAKSRNWTVMTLTLKS